MINEPNRLTHASNNISNDDTRLESSSSSSRVVNAEKFRVQLNVAGFNPETIKTKVEDWKPDGDYNIRKIRKTYELPEHADSNHLTSYVTPNHMLVIEKNQNLTQFGQYRDPLFDYVGFLEGSNFQPRIIDKGNNQKQLELSIEMKHHRPQEIKVSVKNNELVVQGEHHHKDKNRSSLNQQCYHLEHKLINYNHI
ncbi:unnamed protein product [Rotaria sordida]|uniref:SHSP domain-containing protein n=1 Tax=Rotaria sordida TaxID=392033 RepID=A0A818VDA4_9BILA|nr:unnamed protein product [Rotaria sordida]